MLKPPAAIRAGVVVGTDGSFVWTAPCGLW
jgi:hypothetical protein